MAHSEYIIGMGELVRRRIEGNIEVKQQLLADVTVHRAIVEAAMQIVKALQTRGKVFFFGNGGSAADAQHLAAEFTGRYLKERRALAAIGNDYGFDLVFARQLEAFASAGDVAVGISTSGNSPNIVRALEVAKSNSMFSVAMTGASGGIVQTVADCTISVPSCETPRIQECHILAGHLICEIVEQVLCGEAGYERGEAKAESLAIAAGEGAS